MSEISAPRAPEPSRLVGFLRTLRNETLAVVLLAITVSTIYYIYLGDIRAQDIAVVGVIALCPLAIHRFGIREKLLLSVAIGCTVWLFQTEAAPEAIAREALGKAAFLCAFMVTVGILKDVAVTSPSLRHTGLFLTRQPPSLRYVSMAMGSHVMATLLNLGTISMLAPLVQSGVDAARKSGQPDWMWQAKLRRQLSAAMRGFALVIIWTPSTVTQAVLLAVVPAADLKHVIVYGLGFAAIGLTLGWLEDMLRWRGVSRRAAVERAAKGGPAVPVEPAPWGAIIRFLSVAVMLIALTVFIHYETDKSIVQSLMLAAPIVTVLWAAEQSLRIDWRRAPRRIGSQLGTIVRRSIPDSSPEAFTLAVAGYIGALLAALVPSEVVNAALGPEGLPTFVLLMLPPLLIVVANNFTVPPIITATFVGAAIASLEPARVDPNLLVLSLGAGWALCLTSSPYAAPVLLLSRMMNLPGRTITWRWNLGYSLIIFIALAGWIAFLDGFVV